jgi:aminoglycoside phosphotransferase family enzyme/predicted kinase
MFRRDWGLLRIARPSAAAWSLQLARGQRYPDCFDDRWRIPLVTEDQSAVLDFLTLPSTHDGAKVERLDTHSAIVFLAGARAYKLKRAVRFDYLDFSTAGKRRASCDAEVRLNRRMAPTIYRRVLAVTRAQNGALALGGTGTIVDWLIEMNRFPQDALFDRLAAAGELALDLMPLLADAIATFHAGAQPRTDHGGRTGMKWVIDGNAGGFVEFGAGFLGRSACDRVIADTYLELERRAALLDARRQSGFVRQCHGDLHLRNIVLLDGRPTLFDGVEFNDEIACTDVFYDLAFLLMDLWRRHLPRHANVVMNRYLTETGDAEGLSLLPLFLSCRASVRAKTSATAARLQSDAGERERLQSLAIEYLAMAGELLHPPRPSLIAVGGFSGSGKSTLALRLAPRIGAVPGAVVLRSDEIRKRLSGVSPLEHLDATGYSPLVNERVYTSLAETAALVLRCGQSAIVDAVYARSADRQAIERVATRASVPFAGLWLDAPESTLAARAGRRRNDASDADAAVIRTQLSQQTGTIDWHRIDASGDAEAVAEYALARLHLDRPQATNGVSHALA